MLAPFFHELVSKTLARLHNSTAKEGYLDLLLALFRAISVCSFAQSGVRIYKIPLHFLANFHHTPNAGSVRYSSPVSAYR